MKNNLTNFWVVLVSLFNVINGLETQTQINTGCQDQTNQCNKPCSVGFINCNDINNIQCEYGYFKLTVENEIYCIQCPFNVEDRMIYMCMDCKENSETWQYSRKCTYNYIISNGDLQGTFLRQNISEPQLYSVIQSASTNEKFLFSYSVDICMGCDIFCFMSQGIDDCQQTSEPLDAIYDGVRCKDGFYFSDSQCQQCWIANCQTCDPYSDQPCSGCFIGYTYNYDTQSCVKCFDGCIECDGSICITCIQNDDQYLIPTNYGETCSECNYGCARCYVQYDEDYNEIIKCTQCQAGYILHPRGTYCEWCSITDCEICYYEYTINSEKYYTYNLNFVFSDTEQLEQKCYKCKDGYQPNTGGKCELVQNKIDFCQNQKNDDFCFQCENGAQWESSKDGTTQLCSDKKCEKQIRNCLSCISFYLNNQKQIQCLKCQNGFYPDLYSGLCVQCQSRCDTCWQYTNNYNITSYLQLQLFVLQPEQFLIDIKSIEKEQLNDPFCSKCQDGFDFYSNECQGCTENCVEEDGDNSISLCEYLEDVAYCSKCLSPTKSQSLISDNSECNECPTNCIACRERSRSEIDLINPFFNPDYSQLQRFSNFCYKYQKLTDAESLTQLRYIDSNLGVPITCSKNSQFKSCQFEVNYQTNIQCGLELENKMKKSKNSQYTIFLKDLENAQKYNKYNSQQITNIEIDLQFQMDDLNECKFIKPVIIQSKLKQNIFTLKNLTITISSGSDEIVTFKQAGSLTFEDYSRVTIKNIKFKDHIQGNFGIQILGKQTQIIMINCIIDKTQLQSSFSLLMQNTIFMYFSQVHFEKLRNENFINQTSTIKFSSQCQYIFEDVEFIDCEINDVVLQVNQIGQKNLLSLKNILFKKVKFANTQVFSDLQDNPSYQVNIDNFQLIQCSLINSSIFNFALVSDFKALNLESVLTLYQQNSNFLVSTALYVENFFAYRSNFQNGSELIISNAQIYQPDQQNSLKLYYFKKIVFQECFCSNINCLMNIQTPLNSFSIASDILIEQIYITNLQVQDISSTDLNSVTSAAVTIQNVGNVIINDIVVSNSFGLSIFFIGQTELIIIDTAICIFDIDNKYNYYFEEDEKFANFDVNYDLGVEVEVTLTNPYNNLLPNSIDCAEQKIDNFQFSSYFIYIEGFSNHVELKNIEIYNNLFIDRSAIVIKSFQKLQLIQTEEIVLENIYMFYNRLASTLNGQEMSLIQINSEQSQYISITNLQQNSNHLDQITNSQTSETPLCLLIISPYSLIYLADSYFNYNRITNSKNGLMWIKVDEFILSNCSFQKTNILDYSWLEYLEEHQLYDNDSSIYENNLKSYFKILSKGVNLNIIAKFIYIDLLTIEYSYGLSGAGIHLEIIDGTIVLRRSKFYDIQSSLEPSYTTEGGCLSINSETSQMNLELEDISMENCKARQRGGCIHLYPTKFKQNIRITNSSFIQCQSFSYSFFSNPFLESTQTPIVYLEELLITDNNYDNFVQNVPEINLLEQIELGNSQVTAMYFQRTGILSIKSCIFNKIKYVSVLNIIKMTRVIIQDSKFQEITIFLLPIICITFNPQFDSQFEIVQTQFIDNFSPDFSEGQNDCKIYMQESFKQQIDAQDCDITQYIRNYLSFNENTQQTWNDTEYLKYYENIALFKFERPQQQNEIYYSDTTQIISRFNYTLNQSLINCILQSNLELKESQLVYYQSSILSLENVYSNSLVKFDKMDIINNFCLFCDALFQIVGVEATNYNNPLIYLNKINCKNNNVYYFGCFFITNNVLYYIKPNQNIIDLDSLDYFNRLLEEEDYSDNCVIVNNSIFSGNRVKIGSGLSIDTLYTLIMNSIFSDNQASYLGGAIYFVSTEIYNWAYLNVYNITFQNNKAQVGAAIYLKNSEVPDIDSLEVYFDQNKAYIDTDNLLEVTQRLTLSMKLNQQFQVDTYRNMSGDNNNDGYVDNKLEKIRENITLPFHTIGNYPEKTNLLILPSGQSLNLYEYFFEETQEYIPYNWIFRIINLNRFNEAVVNQEDGTKCQIFGRIQSFINYSDSQQFTNNFTIPNEAFYNQEYKGYYADNIQIFFDPQFDKNYYLELKIICDKMEIPIYSEYSEIMAYNKNYELILNIRTFPCQKGEVYQLSQCIPCSPLLNQYSVIKDSILCSQFNSDYMLEIAQTSIKLKPGYWRPDYDNDQAQNCENLQENCKGGWVPGNPSCYTGHIGALCESCDLYMTINDERYTQTAAYKCARCAPTMQLNYIVLIATSITSFISMVLAVKGSYFSSMQFIIQDTLDKMGVLLQSSESDLAVLMKVLTNYFQIIQFIGSFQIALPSSLTQTAKTGGNPTSSTTTAMDCLYVTMSDLDVLYFRMVWSFIQPTIYIVGFYIIYFIGLLLNLVPYKINIITTALIYQFLYLHPTYVEGFIQLASPRTVSGYQYVQRDVAYRYDSTSHQYYLLNYIMPMLIVWVLVLPCLFMFLVFKNRKTLNTKMTKLIYGFFYLEYELNSYLWEFVKLFQKEFMVIILSYYDEQVTVKGLLLVVVMFLYGFYQIQVSPYSNRRLNLLDRYSTVILSISLAMGVLLKSCQEKDFGYLFIIVGIILILINIPFLISILYCIFEGYIIKLSPILDKIRDILNQKYPNLSQTHPWLRPYLFNRAKMSERVKYLWSVLREAVNDTNNLCQNHKLKFKNVFPPYDNDDFQNETVRVGEIQPLIEAQQQNYQSPSLSPEPQTSKIAMQSVLPTGVVQQGQFYNSSFVMNQEQAITGKGVEQWPDNTIYEGQIVNGKKEGKGKVTWPLKDDATQQEYYEGDFKNNQFEGFGIYQWADGKKYEGKWKEGKRDGYGMYQGLNQQYQGEFKNDLYHGQGTLIIGEKKLIGLFEDGKLNGEISVQIGVKKRKGIWKQGKFQQWIN